MEQVKNSPSRPLLRSVKAGAAGTSNRSLIAPAQSARVAQVMKDSPAAEAGLKSQDIILAANDQKADRHRRSVRLLKTNGTKPMTLTIERDGREQSG